MNRFTEACLLAIVLMLAIIAVRPIASPQPAIAATHYKYLVAYPNTNPAGPGDVQAELDKRAAEGWDLVAPVATANGLFLILRKADQ